MQLIAADDIDLAVQAVTAGALVIVPTRRWYMVCGNAQDQDACDRIFAGKGRPRSKALAYVLPQASAAEDLFVMTPHARQLATTFWPGDLALILPWQDIDVARQHESVGVPNALVTMDPGPLGALARLSPAPIAATTANISDATSTASAGPAITPAEVQQFVTEAQLDIAYLIDGGTCPLANHMTIVDCTSNATIIRNGVVHERAVRAALGALPAHG
jgi:L-threonylcarbamoyladenylate synthase